MTNIIIADHHPITRLGIKSHFARDKKKYRIIDEVSNGKKLYNILRKKSVCLLVLEIGMPGINGFHSLKKIKKQFPKTHIIVFSSFPDEIYAHHCLAHGASGYINKTSELEDFSEMISKILNRKNYPNKIDNLEEQESDNIFYKLSARETEVLNLLLKGKRNKDIAVLLNINEKTVSTYKSRLLKKLQVKNLADLIKYMDAIKLLNHSI